MARRRALLGLALVALPALLGACVGGSGASVAPRPLATTPTTSVRTLAPSIAPTTAAPASPSASTAAVATRPDPERAPTDGSVNLAAGFTPDPHERPVTSGGAVDLSVAGDGCRGWAAAAPDVVIDYEAGSMSLLRIYVVAEADADTTLAVHGPDGTWRCNDDASSAGFDPMVDVPAPASGAYAVWVGSFEADAVAGGTLHVTELSANRP